MNIVTYVFSDRVATFPFPRTVKAIALSKPIYPAPMSVDPIPTETSACIIDSNSGKDLDHKVSARVMIVGVQLPRPNNAGSFMFLEWHK